MDGTQGDRLYLDDLVVGQRFVSATHALSVPAIRAFAEAFDPQPFHLDAEAAAHTLFGGLAASGWHTAALTMTLLVGSVPIAGGLIGMGGQVDWPRPTRPDDVLVVESEIVAVVPSRSRPERGLVTLRATTFNQRRETLQVLVCKLVVPRRPGAITVEPVTPSSR